MAGPVPVRVRVRMYQVGFGDCFLVSFEYREKLGDGRDVRHMLVDFGSTHGPKRGTSTVKMEHVAAALRADTGGQLDVLVASHRHADHVSAFGSKKTAEVIESLKPRLIVQPWTEDPKAAGDAITPDDLGFVAGLRDGQAFAERLAVALEKSGPQLRGTANRMHSLALLQFANEKAVNRLHAWADGKGKYLYAGQESGIEDVVPGLSVTVLGPPTVTQWAAVAHQRDEDDEYWKLYRKLLATNSLAAVSSSALRMVDDAADDADAEAAAMARTESVCGPGPARWLIEKLQRHEAFSVERLVQSFDEAMNNTSLVLLFEVGGAGGRRLLFPGDAQIENWGYTLDRASKDAKLRKKLSTVDLYKVGHHGSRNATPKSLYKLWTAPEVVGLPFVTMMSTRLDVHGHTPVTKVPSKTLVGKLQERSTLYSTLDFGKDDVKVELVADVKGSAPFQRVP